MRRKIVIYSSSKPRISKSIQNELKIRNTAIVYSHNNDESISESKLELFGYDGSLKYKTTNISSRSNLIKELKKCIKKIDDMPMGALEKLSRKIGNARINTNNGNNGNNGNNVRKTRDNLLRKCGLPDIPETSHCFSDNTHHTCCMLGSKAREYADASGNPIGSLSSKVQSIKNPSRTRKNIRKSKKVLIPWCTCTGSKVCTYYTDKFGTTDGTHIKFIGTLPSNDKNPDAKNEEKAISKLDIYRHKTPGIISL